MPIRTVAIDRDVRAPVRPRFFSDTGLHRALTSAGLVAMDLGCLIVAILVAATVAAPDWGPLWPNLSWLEVALQAAVLVCVAAMLGLYGGRRTRRDSRKILSAWVTAFIVTLVLSLVLDQNAIGARYVVAWIAAAALDLLGRTCYDAVAALLPDHDQGPAALLLGTPSSCRSAVPMLHALPPASRMDLKGVLLPEGDEVHQAQGELAVLGTDRDLARVLATTGAQQVVIADPIELNGRVRSVMEVCCEKGVALSVVAPGLPASEPVAYIPGLDCPLFVVLPQPAGDASYLAKAVLDRVLSAVLLVALGPVILIIALAIKVTSPGPVFFVDERIGVGQRPFNCHKFRTMECGAHEAQKHLEDQNEAGAVLFKLRDDPRVTTVGRFLRRTSLDELPQLWNVFTGDMSLVGPRPLPTRDCSLMEDSHRRRHVMKPGITGLWQVSGRSDLSFDEMLRLDLQYMKSWSLKTDAYILWRTLGAVLRSKGAY